MVRDRGAWALALGLLAGAAGAQEAAPAREPGWVAGFVEVGDLPPLAARLPAEPLAAEGGAPPEEAAPWGDSLRIALPGEPQGWNLWAGEEAAGLEALLLACLAREEGGTVVPDLAAGWERSADGREVTVRLREGLRWSDGTPVAGADVALAWELGGSASVPGGALEVVDIGTVRIAAPGGVPEAALLSVCPAPSHVPDVAAGGPVPPGVLGLPTLGPWAVVDLWPRDMVVLRRNPYFRMVDEAGRQLPYLDEVQVFLNVPAPSEMARAGAVDLAWPPEGEVTAPLLGPPARPELLRRAGADRDLELYPRTLPGPPGAGGRVEAGGALARPGAP